MKTLKSPPLPQRIRNEDSLLQNRLEAVHVRPVFIMGLHRSGTTFLYESLSHALPLAYLTPYHIVYYRRLLSRYLAGSASDDRAALDAYFDDWSQSNRGVDAVTLSHATPEEYGWLLKRYAGSVHFSAQTAAVFDEMCRKLLYIQERETVLLKSPWDTGRAEAILQHYPEARFIYISRDPVRILHSQLQNALLFSTTPSPYLWMLLDGFPLGKAWFRFQRLLYRIGGERLFVHFMLPLLIRDITGELQGYRRAFQALPPECRFELSYDQLVEQSGPTLVRVCEFLGMEPTIDLDKIQSRPRRTPLHPQVTRVKARFLTRLKGLGLLHDETGT